MQVLTANSSYELDTDKNKIRRIFGVANPTPRQEDDGPWKEFLSMAPNPPEVGSPLFIVWRIDEEPDGEKIARSTLTSLVESVHE